MDNVKAAFEIRIYCGHHVIHNSIDSAISKLNSRHPVSYEPIRVCREIGVKFNMTNMRTFLTEGRVEHEIPNR